MSKILIYDIEVTDLNADWGTLLCVGYKWLGEKNPTVISILDYPGKNFLDDSNLVKAFNSVVAQADMVITYFGKGFDQPWMQAKYSLYDIVPLANVPHTDLFYIAKSNLKISRKSLDNLVNFYSLGKKYNVAVGDWKLAKIGDPHGISEVVKHCFVDVNLTEKLYLKKLRPYVRMHPRLGEYGHCNNCGSSKLQRRGYATTTTKGKRIRAQCTNCGSWHSFPEKEIEKGIVVVGI